MSLPSYYVPLIMYVEVGFLQAIDMILWCGQSEISPPPVPLFDCLAGLRDVYPIGSYSISYSTDETADTTRDHWIRDIAPGTPDVDHVPGLRACWKTI